MDDITNQIKYLEGLIEGKGLQDKSEEGKILAELTKSVGELSKKVDSLEDIILKINDFCLAFLDEMDSLDELIDEMDFADEDEEDLYEITCDECGHVYYADFMDFMNGDTICPKCGKKYNLTEDIFTKLMEGDHNHD